MAEYSVLTVLAVLGVVAVEVFWLRTGLFGSRVYWMALGIVFFFQILVDGWLTKLSAPIVTYNDAEFSRIRFPWDIPIEDFGFGFAMVTLTLLVWVRIARREETR